MGIVTWFVQTGFEPLTDASPPISPPLAPAWKRVSSSYVRYNLLGFTHLEALSWDIRETRIYLTMLTEDYVQWEGRWELIDGIPYAMTPAPGITHQQISQNIAVVLDDALSECIECLALLPVDWKIDEDTVVQPDNLVICDKAEGAYLSKAPVLIFEILSKSTASKDRNPARWSGAIRNWNRIEEVWLNPPKEIRAEAQKLAMAT